MRVDRRTVLVGLGAAAATYLAREIELGALRARVAEAERSATELGEKATALSYNVASGGGVNRKLMPDPSTGRPAIPLDESFSFDRNHAICKVATNPQGFTMPTHKMGGVVIAPGAFYMSMVATTIEQFSVSTGPDGKRRVVMRGGLSCATEVGQATTTLGSRTVSEHATYEVEAVDGGVGGGKAGDSFAYTAFFDEKEAPVNFAIFGPKATFTGEMVEGEVTITDPAR